MATLSRLLAWAHLRAEPNEHILHYRRGKLVKNGRGLAYWFNPLSASVAMVPVEDCETTFVLNERTADFQEVAVQCTLTYRCADPERAAARSNFSISLKSGRWIESPLERLAGLWAQRSRESSRTYLQAVNVDHAMRAGPEVVRAAILEALRADKEVAAMGLAVVTVQVTQIAPAPELQRAIETPTREAIQQKSDEAVFQRRALAVEKERAIKENELATEIELARKQEQLVKQQGANKLLEVRTQAEAEQARVEAELARQALAAQAHSRDTQTRATGDASAKKTLGEADAAVQAKMMEVLKAVSPDVLLALALREMAGKLGKIDHLNITPDLVGEGLQRFFRRQSERP